MTVVREQWFSDRELSEAGSAASPVRRPAALDSPQTRWLMLMERDRWVCGMKAYGELDGSFVHAAASAFRLALSVSTTCPECHHPMRSPFRLLHQWTKGRNHKEWGSRNSLSLSLSKKKGKKKGDASRLAVVRIWGIGRL